MKQTNNGGMKKLILIGVGAMFVYSQFGAMGLIVMGVILMLMN